MDEEISRLQRELQADPGNRTLRERLHHLQERTGNRYKGRFIRDWVSDIATWDNAKREKARKVIVDELGNATLSHLILALQSGDFWTRKRGLEALDSLHSIPSFALFELLSDPSALLRFEAARYLISYGYASCPEAIEPLLRAVKDEKWYVRREALEALKTLYGHLDVDERAQVKVGLFALSKERDRRVIKVLEGVSRAYG